MTFDEKIKWLMKELNHVYCDTCGNEDCDDCHRKYMNWQISEAVATSIVKKLSAVVTCSGGLDEYYNAVDSLNKKK